MGGEGGGSEILIAIESVIGGDGVLEVASVLAKLVESKELLEPVLSAAD